MNNIITTSSILPNIGNASVPVGKTFVGIDFGTSTTVVSIASYDSNGKSITNRTLRLKQLLPDGTVHSSEIVPSVIAWLNGQILVGEGASQLKYELKRGKNIWYSFKMELGEDLGAKYYESELRSVEPYFIRNPKDAARVFFSYLKYLIEGFCAENGLSDNIYYAVSIPASFEANQRKDLLDSLMVNGMKVSKQALIDEPNAAFISYAVSCAADGNPLNVSPDYNSKVLVFDFGGGTCDISILEIGQNAKGFFSKNIAISKFTALGGDDIDRYITYHYLLPRFLKANGKQMEQFRTNEKKRIASALYKVAERLKVIINKNLALMTNNFVVPQVKFSDAKTEVRSHISVLTNKGELVQDSFHLTNRELTDTMNVFLKKGVGGKTVVKGEDDYNSVFSSIDSALRKAHVAKDEVDYVLFIGGSSQSPYIQQAVKEYFEDAEMLVPVNLQTHVSQGAAIHSLLFNGMNKCLIQPITSEPIIVITKDALPKVLLPAGTQIPCNTVEIDDLVTSRAGQKTIELPICVGNSNKMLFNLKIESAIPAGFPANSPIKIVFEVNSDKMLIAQASCMDTVCHIEPVSPFANKELSTEERIALKAERQANLEAERNGGVPSKRCLIELREAYSNAGAYFKAAETYDLQNELYPERGNYNRIGVCFCKAGDEEMANRYYEMAIQENPNDFYALANLGSNLRLRNRSLAKDYLQKALQLKPDHDIALIEIARIEMEEGDAVAAKAKFRKVYDAYLKLWESDRLPDYAFGWFALVADELGEFDLARKVRLAANEGDEHAYFDVDNLSRIKTNMLTSKN